jgi:hypothetical protein
MKNNKQSNPSQEEQPHNRPQPGQQKTEQPKEGDIRKVERSAKEDDNDLNEERPLNTEGNTEDEENTSSTRKDEARNRSTR